MHMADALVSPTVGGAVWAATAGAIVYCSAKVKSDPDDRKVPLMGVLGAFIFAAQMVNFTIPATGSSGHLGGGLLLAVLLGPHAAFLVIASVLTVQALFFADGGLLALGCNIFNLGFFPAFIAYPLIYRKLLQGGGNQGRLTFAAIIAAVTGLQLGALGVVLETTSSGISALPFSTFLLLMQPIHLAIGIVEGVVTATVLAFVYRARPELQQGGVIAATAGRPLRNLLLAFLVAALLTGGIFSWFASAKPDGLEWSISRVTGREELKGAEEGLHGQLARLQQRLSFLPDYTFRKPAANKSEGLVPDHGAKAAVVQGDEKKGERSGTTLAGIIGALLTLAIAGLSGFLLRKRG